MFQSLRSRLLALLTGVVVLAVTAIGVTGAILLRDSQAASARSEMNQALRQLVAQSGHGTSVDAAGLASSTRELQSLTRDHVFIVGGLSIDGINRAHGLAPSAAGAAPKRVSWTQSGVDYTGYELRLGTGSLVVARKVSDIRSTVQSLAFDLVAAVLAPLVAAWIMAAVISRRITRPLNQLVPATNEIALGRYNPPVLDQIQQEDEIGQLAQAFRKMAVQLREGDSRDRRFLMSISHELRTPLTAITGHAQALQDGLADDPEMRDNSLGVIQREAGRLDRLVEDIIDLARLRSNRFNTVTEHVWLDELGDHIMQIFSDQSAHPGITVRGDFEHVAFHSDGHRILQILRNLINNGLRYATTEVTITGERVRSRIRLTVMNDGEPVDPDMRDKIFEPFVGSKREGGMGLGLAIGRELSWALGGNLRLVESETGALFELTLPLEPPGSGR